MIQFFKLRKSTPSVFCLFCACFFSFSTLFGQTPDIVAAEKALDIAKKDSLNTPQYSGALKGLWQAYNSYLQAEKQNMPDSIKVVLLQKEAAYRVTFDSLAIVAAKVKKSNIAAFCKKIQEKEQGLYRDMIGSLDSISTFYNDIKSDFAKALPFLYLKSKLTKRTGDKAAYFKNEYEKAVAHKYTSGFDTAQAILTTAIKELNNEIKGFEQRSVYEKTRPENLWFRKSKSRHINLLNELGEVSGRRRNYDLAISYHKQAVTLFNEAVNDSFNIIAENAIPHYWLANTYQKNNVLDSAQLVLTEGLSLATQKPVLREYLRNSLSAIYVLKGEISKALQISKEDYDNTKEEEARAHIASHIAVIYLADGVQYDEAEKWFDLFAHYALKKYGKNSYIGESYPASMRGIIAFRKRDYQKAKFYLEKALEINALLNLEKSQTVSDYDQYALLLETLGQYEQSLEIRKQVYADTKTFAFEKQTELYTALANLGHDYMKLNKFDAALACFKEVDSLITNAKTDYTEDYFIILYKMSIILIQRNDLVTAELNIRKAFALEQKNETIKPKYRGTARFYLSSLLRKQNKNIGEAINLSNEAMLLLRGGDFYQKAQLNRVLLHENQRENTQAVDSLNSLFQGIQLRIDKEFGYLYEKEKTAFMSMLDQDLFGTMQAAFARLYLKGEAARSGALFYNTLLLQKELSVLDTRSLKYKSFLSGDSVLQEQVYKIGFWQDKAVEKGVSNAEQAKISANIATLKTAIETKHPQFFEKNALGTTWQTVQKQLKPDEIAIEFADVLNNDDDTTKIRNYYALVIKADSKYPSVIPLFEEKELVKLLDETRFYKHDSKTNVPILSDEETVKRRYNTENGKKLYNLIWKPLENAQILRGVQTVHFAPSGLLNRVAFAALPVGGNLEKLLLHTYTLRQYNTTRALVETTPRPAASAKDLVAFGDIQYGSCQQDSSGRASIETMPLENTDALVARSALFLDSTTIHWQDLPNSKRELANIEKSHKKYQPNAAFTAFTGYNASEARFKTLGTRGKLSPSHLFISTHGYGNPTNYPESRYASAALHRAGLVMATANWTTECPIKRDIEEEDGILTAYEIAQLNFSNTELVVLSGCQTGLGDICGREGVLGLTRGFKLAGVNHIIASLWAVPDKDTADFMTTFYDLYLSGKSITQAFEDTQKAMQQEQSVYSWGAWVLIK